MDSTGKDIGEGLLLFVTVLLLVYRVRRVLAERPNVQVQDGFLLVLSVTMTLILAFAIAVDHA